MNDISPSRGSRPSKQPYTKPSQSRATLPTANGTANMQQLRSMGAQASSMPGSQSANPQPFSPPPKKPALLLAEKKPPRFKKILWWLGGIILFLGLAIGAALWWYFFSLTPFSGGDSSRVRVEIPVGTAPSDIGRLLEEKKLIRSQYAFEIYTKALGVRNQLQAGVYSLSPSESTEQIVNHLVAGKVDTFSITFLPGATLSEHRKSLINAGYSVAEVDAALQKTYEGSLFVGKPLGTDLEGYIYGETYTFPSGASVEDVLMKIFDHYETVLEQHTIIEGLKARGLTPYQGITLASIIQKEVSGASDQKQVAQVFYTRMTIGMPLGADATFRFAAKKLGVPPAVDLESPYNTRKYAGLPPGPIASPGLGALQATASPATGDYLYFVSGDDGKTYFSRTLEEHEAATRAYCHENCKL